MERCVERVGTRQGHGFTDEPATRQMHAQFARAEIARRHVFADPLDDADSVAAEVLTRFNNGELVYNL